MAFTSHEFGFHIADGMTRFYAILSPSRMLSPLPVPVLLRFHFVNFVFLFSWMFVRLSEDFSGRIDTFPIGNWWKALYTFIYKDRIVTTYYTTFVYSMVWCVLCCCWLRCIGNVGNHVIFDWNENKNLNILHIFQFSKSPKIEISKYIETNRPSYECVSK